MDDATYQRLMALENRMARMENNAAPTIPSYDSTNFPQDAVHGQIVKDINDHSMWVYGEDDTWHKVGGGGGSSGAFAQYHRSSLGGTDPAYTIPANTNIRIPFTFTNYRSSTDATAIQVNAIGFSNPYDSVYINYDFSHPGAYICYANVQFNIGSTDASAIVYDNSSSTDQLPHMSEGGTSPLDTGWSVTSGRGIPTNQDHTVIYADSRTLISLMVQNTNSFGIIARLAYLAIVYVPAPNTDNAGFL